MVQKRLLGGLIVLSMMLMTVSVALALDPSGAVASGIVDYGEMPAYAAGSINVLSGNVTNANLDTNVSTYKWAAVQGSVTGSIVLGDAGSNQVYAWTAQGAFVYAAEGSPDWSTLATTTIAAVEANADTVHLADAVGISDSATDTLTDAGHDCDSQIFNLGATTAVQTYDDTETPAWWTCVYVDGSAEQVWVGEVSEDGTSYRGDTVDYQLLLPEDGTAYNTAVTSYNLWLELQ